MTRVALSFAIGAMVALGQPSGGVNAKPTNVDFREGEVGKTPPGWHVPPIVLAAGYTAKLRRGDCPESFPECVEFHAPTEIADVRAAELEQTFPAAAYLGRKTRFSGWLRSQGFANGDVELRMRVDYADGKVEIFDSVQGPVTAAEFQRRQVVGRVGEGARSVSIWVRFHPRGPGWVSDLSFDTIEEPARADQKTDSR